MPIKTSCVTACLNNLYWKNFIGMKKSTYSLIGLVLLGVAATTVTGVMCKVRNKRLQRRLINAANEGYETAHDIIYPDSYSSNDKKLRYGPVF